MEKQTTAGKLSTNLRAGAEQHYFNILKNVTYDMTLCLNIFINNILIRKRVGQNIFASFNPEKEGKGYISHI